MAVGVNTATSSCAATRKEKISVGRPCLGLGKISIHPASLSAVTPGLLNMFIP